MPLKDRQTWYFLYPTLNNKNITKTYNFAARVTVAPLILGVK